MTTLQPVSSQERIDLIDVVRGFALFGVLLANLVWLTTDVVLTDHRLSQLPTAALDRVVKQLVVFFVDGKFYTLFSFLFGVGFAVQLSRAEARGRRPTGLYSRRVAVLALVGLLHIVLLWYGDILLVYAVVGFALLLVRRWNGRLLIVLALSLALFARATTGIGRRLANPPAASATSGLNAADADRERRLAIFDGDSYGAIARENISFYYGSIVAQGLALFMLPQVFARFLFGLYVGRRGWVEHTDDLLPTLRRVLPWTAAMGVVGNGTWLIEHYLEHTHVLSSDSYWVLAAMPVIEVGILAMALTYLSILVLLFHHSGTWRRRLGRLGPVGRMALTNYLTHSMLYVLLFTGVGFGLLGEVGPALCVPLSLAIFALQVQFSRWWLAHFRFGPAEWLWRTFTYGQLQPMRAAN